MLEDLALALKKRRLISEQGWQMIPVLWKTDFVVVLETERLT